MKNYGLQPDIITPEHYTLLGGQLPLEELQPDGQWDNDLPEFETQIKNFETFSCTSHGTDNCIETVIKKKYNEVANYSDRALGILAGTGKANGNSPHVVAEAIRKNGCIPEDKLPFSDHLTSKDEFYAPDPLPDDLLRYGKEWLAEFDFGHDWVFSSSDLVSQSVANKVKLMKAALKSSPIGISVCAWFENDGVYIKPDGSTDNHWCMCYGWNDKGWKVFDSYDGGFKIYSFDADITFAKRFTVNRKTVPKQVISGQNSSKYSTFLAFLHRWLGILLKRSG